MSFMIIRIISVAFTVYYWMIIARVILSWFPQLGQNEQIRPIINFIFELTEPFLKIFRKIIPSVGLGGAGIDFSPFIAIITLLIVQNIIVQILQMVL